ncbi:hypothetical protein K432DRAFT_406960 [Lepidopterella palustris CBS 459.81]|uniref:DUF7587 domain-containing protein n=1 Tax=Lepidopterella palustris CBS 459.81 TaxID=1314670 RepID=A0A8E2JCY3_9PEZI|nr:hypothetical protein K432DRAFT_406960 [Lepidopterella palustris CBS 459.81]
MACRSAFPQNSESTVPPNSTSSGTISSSDYETLDEENGRRLSFIDSRQLLFRTCHRLSQGSNERDRDITAGRLVQGPFPTQAEWYETISKHVKGAKTLSPHISLTSDLLRAINLAFKFQRHDMRDVIIFVVDRTKLDSGSVFDVNTAINFLGGKTEPMYNTEILVWQKIPMEAVICSWSLDELVTLSDIFTFLKSAGGQKLGKTRNALRSHADFPTIPRIVTLATRQLGMNPDSFTTMQLVMTMVAWTNKKCTMKELQDFETSIAIEERHEIDCALYSARDNSPHLDFREWRRRRQSQALHGVSEISGVIKIIKSFRNTENE